MATHAAAAGATVALVRQAHPGDVGPLRAALAPGGGLDPARVVCVLGKTEGNGCVNDFSRGYAADAVTRALAEARGCSLEQVKSEAAVIMSGGTEGILTPHLTLLLRAAAAEVQEAPVGVSRQRLVVARACTRPFLPEEIGTGVQVEGTARAVEEAMVRAGILNTEEVTFVQVKCPLITSERVTEAAARGRAVRTEDCYHSMALSRGASALGVALACGELPTGVSAGALVELQMCRDYSVYSAVASASAGVELLHSEVVVLGNSSRSSSALRSGRALMRDALDTRPVLRLLRDQAGLEFEDGQLSDPDGRLVCCLAKADPAPVVRGERTTQLTDSDVNATRHARAAVGGALGALLGRTTLYVSGGAEHQGPPGGGPVCAIWCAEP